MGKVPGLFELSQSQTVRVLRHPEQRHHLNLIKLMLDRMDSARYDPSLLYTFQRDLFQASFRVHMVASKINRTLSRLANGKAPDFLGDVRDDERARLDPAWELACDVQNTNIDDWRLEALVADRAIRQLQTVADGLAWRLYRYDRREMIALADHQEVGSLYGKTGLWAELNRIDDIFRSSGQFALLNDLTTILRHGDLTMVEGVSRRALIEVKTSDTVASRRKSARQEVATLRALSTAKGTEPLASCGAHIVRTEVQLRTHVRRLAGVLDTAKRNGWVVTRIADRVVGAWYFPAVAVRAPDLAHMEQAWANYSRRRMQQQVRVMPDAVQPLKAALTFSEKRNPNYAPLSVFPLSAAHRALLICDAFHVETFMDPTQLANEFGHAGYPARVLRRPGDKLEADVIEAMTPHGLLTVHVGAVTQLLTEFVDTECFVRAYAQSYETNQRTGSQVLTFSNEQAAWK